MSDQIPGIRSLFIEPIVFSLQSCGRGFTHGLRARHLPLGALPLLLATGALLSSVSISYAQDLGHRLPGLVGLDAARVPEPGLYFADRLAYFQAGKLRDRNGNIIPVGELDLRSFANAFGLSYTTRLSNGSTYWTATVGAPIARFRLNVHDRPEASVDRFGLADVYIQPARFGWRWDRRDLVAAYGVYVPTGRSPLAGGQGLSQGQITHQFSGGGSVYTNSGRTTFVTALASYQLNGRKFGVDITRGDTIQVEGGVGSKFLGGGLEAGLAGYSLWQVRDDHGSDIPAVLAGARDRVYGLGPEAALLIPAIRGQVRLRFAWDFGVQSRPQGRLLVVTFNSRLSQP